MTTPVIFPIAKLLKEKGFDEPCNHVHYEHKLYSYTKRGGVKNSDKKEQQWICTAPTISEVVMWLYEKHGIWISIDMVYEEDQTGFWYCIRESKIDDVAVQSEEYNSPTEAYEAAIEYTLKNLIK